MNSRFFPAFILSLLFGFALAAPTYAQAGTQIAIYEVYAGGIHAVQARLDIDTTRAGRYSISLGAKTRGFLGSLAPWEGTFESHGWVMEDGTLRPELHKSTAVWRDEPEIKEYFYNRDGTFKGLTITENHKPARTDLPDVALTLGTTDVLSATLTALRAVAAGQQCNGDAEVFDGDRRFRQVFVHQDNPQLTESKYNIFRGEAEECTVEVVPVGGKWHEKPRGWMSIQEQGREKGTMPTVWMAQLENGAPAIPVKIRVKTEYGTLFMHLAEYRGAGKTVVAEKRVQE